MENRFLALQIVKALQKNGVEFIQSAVYTVTGILDKFQPEKPEKKPRFHIREFKPKIIVDDLIDD